MGPVGMITVVDQYMRLPFLSSLSNMLGLAYQISMFLFLFNMLPLPLPLLDGGWVVILILERILRREFTAEQKAAAQMVGLAGVFVLFVWIMYGDIPAAFKYFFGG
jgi:regulator of sigma E protease